MKEPAQDDVTHEPSSTTQTENEIETQIRNKSEDSQLASLRLPQNFDHLVGGQKFIHQIRVRKPDKQWFIRTHHNAEMWFHAAILDFQEDREAYVVDRKLWDELAIEIVPKVLVPSITTHGHSFLWPIRLPGEDNRIDDWNRSALNAAELAQKKWIRVMSNMSLGSYETLVAATVHPDPTWPELGLEEWITLGFRDRIITSTEHPVVRRLRGEQ